MMKNEGKKEHTTQLKSSSHMSIINFILANLNSVQRKKKKYNIDLDDINF